MESQGYVGVSDAELLEVMPWTRMATRLCMIWTLGATLFGSAATVWLAAAGWASYSGATTLGYLLGGSLALASAVPTFTDFCIPSYFYGLMFGKPTAGRRAKP